MMEPPVKIEIFQEKKLANIAASARAELVSFRVCVCVCEMSCQFRLSSLKEGPKALVLPQTKSE